ncbi:hypothetical protein BCV72DRAFT_217985, partial [Rhizopus microsporus var. microsporus]
PSQHPDLNPIEHVWHQIKLNLSLYETRAKNVSELWERVNIEWDKLDADTCRRYIDSTPGRIEAIIEQMAVTRVIDLLNYYIITFKSSSTYLLKLSPFRM